MKRIKESKKRTRQYVKSPVKNIAEGFTLVEVIVVLAIMSILFGSCVKVYYHLEGYQLKQAALNAKDFIETTKQTAALTNKFYQVVCKNNGDNIGLVQECESIAYDQLEFSTAIEAGIGSLSDPITEGAIINSKRFKFDSDMSPRESGTLTLRHKITKKVIQLTVQPVTGKVTLYQR